MGLEFAVAALKEAKNPQKSLTPASFPCDYGENK